MLPLLFAPAVWLSFRHSEVSACHVRIAALESELTVATAEHNTRLAQQQKAFLAKLEQLRQVHNQQVAAAIREAQVCLGLLCKQRSCKCERCADGSRSTLQRPKH